MIEVTVNTVATKGQTKPSTTQYSPAASIVSLWRRFPVLIRAVLSGILLAAGGTIPWAVLVSANIKHVAGIPWAVPPAALYLWLFWRFARGFDGLRSAETRRRWCRANSLPGDVWGMAIAAGVLGLAAVVLFQLIMVRIVTLPQQHNIDATKFPFLTLASWILMGAVVAGVVEETAFRGYIQGPIERRHGPMIAILVTGSVFGLAHFTHPEVGLILLPYYLAVAAVYGGLAYLTNSILPSLLLHTGGNILGAFSVFTRGASEWQASSAPPRLIWETGVDASFLIVLIAFVSLAVGAIAAYRALARVAMKS